MLITKEDYYTALNKVGNTIPTMIEVGDLVTLFSKKTKGHDERFEKSFNQKVIKIEPKVVYNAVISNLITFKSHQGKLFTLNFNRLGFHYNNKNNELLSTYMIKQ